jgi:hypothetical protein
MAKHAADAALIAETRCIRRPVLVNPAACDACCAAAFPSNMTELATAAAVRGCAAVGASSIMAYFATDAANRVAIVHVWSHLAGLLHHHDASSSAACALWVLCDCCCHCCSCDAAGRQTDFHINTQYTPCAQPNTAGRKEQAEHMLSAAITLRTTGCCSGLGISQKDHARVNKCRKCERLQGS